MIHPEGLEIRSEDDIRQITHTSEQQFARALLTKPHLKIIHEHDIFWAEAYRQTENGTKEPVTVGHLPDFRIENPHNQQAGPIYVEITQRSYDPKNDPPEEDPKAKHKQVMKQAGGVRHVVLYKANLEAVEKATGVPIIDASYSEKPPSQKEAEKKYVFPQLNSNNT